jgi:hypothetical protein
MNYRPYFLATVCLFFLFSACKTVPTDKSDEILGLPPTEREDPFFFVTLPAEAEEAKASGRIGDDSAEAKTTSMETFSSTLPTTKTQCFSCVKICESEPCEDADTICGWGVDYDKESAMLRATAECDGALNLARNNPQWKRVIGSCPIATCQ